ncbi:unnamed protein product [Vitrella brassicaformis CCMP3155]|uniref:Uncharacterized protein n=1 Tax=Vitrella brassicaformis (strain CCMP3155) TaxID=1169540 RepID=A0A0G4FNY2_VITBC|nr:unnamed protein product [Vitrella brassicaformis CCMP3155]|eukprot:CEM15521.1 unnamed protein product [Vitrella brassicaformis CCMP3155]
MDTNNDGDGPAPSTRGGSGGGSGGDLLQKIRAMRSDASSFLSGVDLAEQMIATHTDNKQEGEMVDGSLSTVLETLSDTHSALGKQLAQIATDCNTHRMAAGGAVGPNETDNNAQQGRAVPADDGGAKKRRRVDISHAADSGGHSGGGSVGPGCAAAASTGIQHPQQQQQQHPVWYVLAQRGSDFPLQDVLRLRKSCSWARGLFGAPQLQQRLTHSLSAEAGLRRTANGQQLLTFDQQQLGVGDLPAALCAYLADPCVLAQLKMVGPHIHFGDGVAFQLFQHGDTLRAVKDEDGFEMTIPEIDTDQTLPPNHLYQQHRQPHDPPVRSNIEYRPSAGWAQLALP